MYNKKIVSFFFISANFILFPAFFPAAASAEIEHHGYVINDSSDSVCFECHGENAPLEMQKKTEDCSQTNQSSHPLHLYFPPRGKESQFKTRIEAQEKGIRFDNGKVTCLSCHNLAVTGKGHLAVDNFNSRLCMACHNM